MEALNQEVLAALAGDVLQPYLIEEIVTAAREMHESERHDDDQDRVRRDLQAVEAEQKRLTEALSAGADMPVIVERLKATEKRRLELLSHLGPSATQVQRPTWNQIEKRVRQSLTKWREMLAGDMAEARSGLRQLLTGPIVFTPFVDERGRSGIRFEGRVGLDAVLGGELVTKLASPTGSGTLWTVRRSGLLAA